MILFVIFIIWFFFELEKYRRKHTEVLFLKYAYRLYALRDELRELILTKKVKANNWVFIYLDSSIAKAIDYLSKLNIYQVIFLYFMHKNDFRLNTARGHLMRELRKDCNVELNKIQNNYALLIGTFMFERHRALTLFTLTAMLISLTTKVKWREFCKMITEWPETSAILTANIA